MTTATHAWRLALLVCAGWLLAPWAHGQEQFTVKRDVALRASIELRTPSLSDDEQPDGLAAINVRSSDRHDFQLNVIRSAALPENGLQRVRWWLKGDTLYRAEAEVRDRYPLPAPKNG